MRNTVRHLWILCLLTVFPLNTAAAGQISFPSTPDAERALTFASAGSDSGGFLIPETDIVLPIRKDVEFWVSIEARNLPPVRGLGMTVRYNRPDMMEAITVEDNEFLGREVLRVIRIDADSARVSAAMFSNSAQTGPEWSGTVIRILFRALADIPEGTSLTFSIRESEAVYLSNRVFPLEGRELRLGGGPLGVQAVPFRFGLKQNYPNPFNPETSIEYELPAESNVRLEVRNISGQLVRVLVDSHQPQGRHTVVWNARDNRGKRVSAGVYFYTLLVGEHTAVRKMLLLP
jgi:hypothetical protein